MNIKTYIAAAVIALTAACNQTEQTETNVDIPVDEAAAATASAEVQLNDDGSVKEVQKADKAQ